MRLFAWLLWDFILFFYLFFFLTVIVEVEFIQGEIFQMYFLEEDHFQKLDQPRVVA